MCRCKFLALALVWVAAFGARADEGSNFESTSADRTPAAEKSAKVYPLASQFEAGLSYVQWNETIGISRGATASKGYVNYAGPGLTFDYNRRRARWQWGASTTIAAGKAAAGGFSNFLTYPDGV
ncbi:MAG: hypothetical protein V4760_08370, partial [Bdellovibrionota bacterium]